MNREVFVRELDLRACHPHSISDTINAVPGLKTSTAFLTFLRANLVLNPSALSSNCNTPLLEPVTTSTHARISSPLSAIPLIPVDDDDDIPSLSLEALDDEDDKADGVNLVADSVAEMGHRAFKTVAMHPLSLAGLATTAVAVHRLASGSTRGASFALMLSSTVLLVYVLGIWLATRGYSSVAEDIRRSWFQSRRGESDIVIGARFDDELVGTLVLKLMPSPLARKKNRNTCFKGGKGVIQAWTTRAGHRGDGIGKELLRAAVKATKERCGKDAEVGFALEHAHSTMLLPSIFNRPFRRDEIKATVALSNTVADWEASKKKR